MYAINLIYYLKYFHDHYVSLSLRHFYFCILKIFLKKIEIFLFFICFKLIFFCIFIIFLVPLFTFSCMLKRKNYLI